LQTDCFLKSRNYLSCLWDHEKRSSLCERLRRLLSRALQEPPHRSPRDPHSLSRLLLREPFQVNQPKRLHLSRLDVNRLRVSLREGNKSAQGWNLSQTDRFRESSSSAASTPRSPRHPSSSYRVRHNLYIYLCIIT